MSDFVPPSRSARTSRWRRISAVTVAGLAATLAGLAHAGVLQAKDGRFEADVSARQMSRISIAGEKIASVRKLDEPGGPQLMVDTDEKTGDVFVAFDGDVAGRAFTAFLTTESGKVVQAVLHPVLGEGQNVLVRLEAAAGAARASGVVPGPGPVAANYPERLVGFIRAMFADQEAEGLTRRVLGQGAMKAGPFTVRETTAWEGGGLKGRVLYVTNVGLTDEPVRLAAFLVDRVLAAATSHERLRPGEQGRVFIVEEGR